MKRWIGLSAAIGLGALTGCTNTLDALESQQQDFVAYACSCDFEAAGYASESECVREELADFEGFDACERQAFAEVPSLQPAYDCALNVNADYLACLGGAACDETAETACGEAQDAALEDCPQPSDADLERAGAIVRDCRAGGPGTCPDTSAGAAGVIASGTTEGAGADSSGSCGGENAADFTVEFTAPSAGAWSFDTFGSGYDTVLYALSGCGGAELACNDDEGEGLQSAIVVELTAGQTIVLVVDGFGTEAGSFVLNATPL